MAEISLCMIVKNEENNLPDCLNSIADIVDEINIVDTGSTDNTVEVAKRYTDRVFYFAWIDDFAAARNFSYSKATKDFIMWMDADDILTPENQDKLLRLKKTLDDTTDFVIGQYRTHYNDDHSSSMIFPKIRITRKAAGFQWKWAVHEDLEPHGSGMTANLYIDHKYKDHRPSTERNMRILKREVDSGRADTRIKYFYGLSCYLQGKNEEAEQLFNTVIQSYDSETFDPLEMYLALHNIYRLRGDNQKALAVLVDNECLMSDKSEFYCCLGEFYRDTLNNPYKACDFFEQALGCKGTFIRKEIPGQRNPEFYYHIPHALLGKTYIGLRESEAALMHYEAALAYKNNQDIELITRKLKRIIALQRYADVVNV